MANCSNCSAPLSTGSMKCSYCGSLNDIDLKGVHYFTTHEADSERTCPRCQIPLKTIDLKLDGRFLVERCDGCLGLFFDPGELEALLQATVTNVYAINRKQLDSLNNARQGVDYGVTYVKCPVCGTVMSRVNFGARSGVIVDRCPDHGIWLDGGELRKLFEWTKAGGSLLEKERREREQQEKEREDRLRAARQGGIAGSLERESDRGLFGEPEPDLFRILEKVARFFS